MKIKLLMLSHLKYLKMNLSFHGLILQLLLTQIINPKLMLKDLRELINPNKQDHNIL
jgi:hypothetical protein